MGPTADSPATTVRVLLVDDDEDDFVLTRDLLAELGDGCFSLDWAATYDAALPIALAGRHDVYLLDYNLGARTGLELLRELRAAGCDDPLILLTGQGDRAIDLQAMRSGAADYVSKKGLDAIRLERAIRFAIDRKRHEDDLRAMRDELEVRVRERTAELERANELLRIEVAERCRAEEERSRLLAREQQARAEAESANLAKDRFLAMLSHELRTPLNPVLLAASAAADDPETPGSIRATMQMIRHNIELEARLIEDLLDVTRIASGKLALARGVVDVLAVLDRVIGICRPEISSGSLVLETDFRVDRAHVLGDPARMKQVFWNLVKNSAKFTPPGGSIRLRAWNEPRDRDVRGGDELVVSVEDTGVGIEPAALGRIFTAFEQTGEIVTRKFGGLGLGLAIARSIVEAHGGTISAHSEGPGRGARFVVRVPCVVAPAATGQEPHPSGDGESRPRRILVVEDDLQSRATLTRLLRKDGHDVIEAESASAASIAIQRFRPDLIISDIGLPGVSGLDLIREILANHKVTAIALTGYGSERDLRRTREAGFAAHLTKPIDIGKLRGLIRDLPSET